MPEIGDTFTQVWLASMVLTPQMSGDEAKTASVSVLRSKVERVFNVGAKLIW